MGLRSRQRGGGEGAVNLDAILKQVLPTYKIRPFGCLCLVQASFKSRPSKCLQKYYVDNQ